MIALILLCTATRALALQPSDAAWVQRGTPGYEKLLEKNWVGNVEFGSAKAIVPASLEELESAVRGARAPVRVVGRGHSFTPVAECAGGTLLSLARLNRVLDFRAPMADRLGSITIEGGCTYTEVIQHLGERGALRNLPSCPQFTVAGAIATGTHGSGIHIQNLAADVSMLEFMLPNGTTVSYDRERTPELIEGVRVHLGCLGVVTKLTLDVVPYFEVAAYRYDDVPLETAIESLPDVFKTCDSLSIWTSGFGTGPGAGLAWMTYRHFHPHWSSHAVPKHVPPAFGTPQLAKMERYLTDPADPKFFSPTTRGPWSTTLALTIDDELEETSMKALDLQSEFFVPLEHAQDAVRAVAEVASGWSFSSPHSSVGTPVKGIVDAFEFRCVKGDGSWISPHPVDSLGVHTSFNADPALLEEAKDAVAAIEAALRPFGVRAHWGKLSSAAAHQIETSKLERFRALCDAHDPDGVFRNEHVRRVLWGKD
ncbi:unnamed protein product [Pelagomonas calceolata]|uniref:FAD-binding PCMH-type domain-containing protein n=2 Tax=Pelagomonas calceolata TaxID=35677 RepID=A0A8J2X4H2_9STRA|nr:unnamed protein product [Pelagomonas calceolata]